MPLGSRSRSRTKCPLYPLLSCQSSSVAPQMPHEFGEWFSVRSPVSASQRHFPLAPGCLPGLRGGADGGVHGLAAAEPLTSSFWPPSPLDGSPPKGLSDDGGFEEFVEVLASRSASSTVIACNRHRSSRRAPELSPSKKARFIAERLTGGLFDMPAKESDSRLPRQHFSPETAQSSQYTAPPRIRDCERFRNTFVKNPNLSVYCNICNPFLYETAIVTNKSVRTAHLKDTDDLYNDIAKGELPAVSYVKPGGFLDGHPASSKFDLFEAFTKKIVDGIKAKSKLWAHTAVFITNDEGGGFYDSGYIQTLDFFGDGTRIPLIAVSPFSRGGRVVHDYADHPPS